MMAGIRAKNTTPEMLVRKALFSKGYRYRLNVKTLLGHPDIVLPKHKVIIFVHGCFWHLHGCRNFKWPSTRPVFWRNKLMANRDRDKKIISDLESAGWRVVVLWECEIHENIQAVIKNFENMLKVT